MRLILCVSILFLAACNEKLEQGVVVAKELEPERTWLQLVPIVISNGKRTTTHMIQMWHFDDEDFVVIIRGKNKNEEIAEVRMYAKNREDWDLILIGDEFNSGEVDNIILAYSDPVKKTKARNVAK